MDSTPLLRLRQNCSTVLAPGTRRAMPMMAMSVTDVSRCSVMATLEVSSNEVVRKVQNLGDMYADAGRTYRAHAQSVTMNLQRFAVNRY